MGAELFHVDRRTNIHSELIITFHMRTRLKICLYLFNVNFSGIFFHAPCNSRTARLDLKMIIKTEHALS